MPSSLPRAGHAQKPRHVKGLESTHRGHQIDHGLWSVPPAVREASPRHLPSDCKDDDEFVHFHVAIRRIRSDTHSNIN